MNERPPKDLREQRMSLHKSLIWLCKAIEKHPRVTYRFGGVLSNACSAGGDIEATAEYAGERPEDVDDIRLAPLSTAETLALAVLSGDDRRAEPALADYLIEAGIDPVAAARRAALVEAERIVSEAWFAVNTLCAGCVNSPGNGRPVTAYRQSLRFVGEAVHGIRKLIDPDATEPLESWYSKHDPDGVDESPEPDESE